MLEVLSMGKGLNRINRNNRANVSEKKECTMKLSGMRIFLSKSEKNFKSNLFFESKGLCCLRMSFKTK